MPGGGVGKAWDTPGAYAIKVEKGVFPSGTVKTSVVVKDVMKGLCESFAYSTEGMSVVFRGGFLSGLLEKFFSHAYLVSFSIGGADVRFDEKSSSFSLHSTDKDTSWFIKSHRDIKLSGVFKNCVCETD